MPSASASSADALFALAFCLVATLTAEDVGMGETHEARKGVTVVLVRRVKRGHEDDYEAWLPKIIAAMRRSPGFVGFENLRPVKGLQDEYVLILRFDSEVNLHRWEASPERKRWLAESTEFTENL